MATEIHFEPTLFLFLGTSSGQVGWRLKELLHRAYGDIPILRFLWVDADTTVDPEAARWLTPHERTELVGFNGDVVLDHLNEYPAIRAWWPRDSRLKPGHIQRGAKQIRLYGRLALFRMFNERATGPAFIDKLQSAANAIGLIENSDATEAKSTERFKYTVERNSARVVIVSSTCGGTGSSMTFDLAYLCRDILRGRELTVISISILPAVIDKAIKNETQAQREKIRANTYAWFKENEYLLTNPRWNVTYPEGAPLNIAAPPFDLNFVIDITNQAGDRLSSADDVYSLVAQAIFLDTGSPLGGAIRGFNANVSILLEEVQGRQRAYSSLAAAALVYPAARIQRYCAARLAQDLVDRGFLAPPDPLEAQKTAAGLLSRLRLRDDQLLIDLLADRQITNPTAPAIRKAESAEKARGLLEKQVNADSLERPRQIEKIAAKAAALLQDDLRDLPLEIADVARQQGALFAQAVLDTLTGEPQRNDLAAEEIWSFPACIQRLNQQGASEADLQKAEETYRQAHERLRSMESDPKLAALRLVARKHWQRLFDGAKNDCLHWLAEVNRLTLQVAAQREALTYYTALHELVTRLKAHAASLLQSLKATRQDLEQLAKAALTPRASETHLYELTLEVVDEAYIRDYYQRHAGQIDPMVVFRDFARQLQELTMEQMAAWHKAELAEAMVQQAGHAFVEELANISLLQALAQYHGAQAASVIEAQFERLLRHCHPFWRYDADRGIGGLEGKSLLGMEDETDPLIPARYRDHEQYEIKSTGIKHEIFATRVLHGLPAFLLRDIEEYRTYYNQKRKGIDPLHVLPEAAPAGEVIPEEHQEARLTFTVASCFGLIIQIGTWFYFDPARRYGKDKIHPGRNNQLGQGYQNAENAFVQQDQMVRQADQIIEQEITRIGNEAAIKQLEECLQKHRQALAGMPIDSELRVYFEKSIRALRTKQRQLGYLGGQEDVE